MSITKDILDADGNVVGQVTFPDTASETDISRTLSTYTEPTHIPDVTPRQIRQALILKGVSMDSIDAALSSMPEPVQSLARAEWEYSIAFQRNRPLVAQVGQMLGWSSNQLDDLWHFAGTL